MATVDLKTASLILDRAFMQAEPAADALGRCIEHVLRGTHKTYRYILVTALLAKATCEEVNPLSLQRGDGEGGKYDARSLCHKVLVPFETMKLPGCLGGSNEPFLNKPARFVMLSVDNAVRSGKDAGTLKEVMDILSEITSSNKAFIYLKSALAVMKALSAEYVAKFSVGDCLLDVSEFTQVVLDYIYKLTDHSSEGEVCPLVVSVLEQMFLGRAFRVVPHKVNESGASSKEVGDIDVLDKNGRIVYAIEVKDKNFKVQDVAHAVTKFRHAGLSTGLFVYGKHVEFDEGAVFDYLREVGREGHYCCLISILHYAKLRIADLKTLTIREFVDGLLRFSEAINAKDDTLNAIKEIAVKIFQKT